MSENQRPSADGGERIADPDNTPGVNALGPDDRSTQPCELDIAEEEMEARARNGQEDSVTDE